MVKGVISKFAACALAVLLMAGSAFAAAGISAPANGAKLGELPTFTVAKEPGQDYAWVYVGSTLGGYQYFSQSIDNATSFTVPGLPADNSTIYVQVWTRKGGAYMATKTNYEFIARWSATGASDAAAITSPANNASLTMQQTFTIENVGQTKSWIYISDTAPGAYNLGTYTLGTSKSFTLKNLPTDKTIYIRLFTYFGNFRAYQDFNYNTSTAVMISPVNGATLGKPAVFTWADDGADYYWLYIGSTKGGYQYYSVNQGANLTATVPGLPYNGSTVYVRLWSRHGANYAYNDYTYTANSTGSTDLAKMTTPAADNATIDNSTSTATFVWDNATKTGATGYWLWVGSTQGSYNLYTGNQHTNNTATLNRTSWPTKVWTRLFTNIGLFQKYVDNYYKVKAYQP